MTAPRTVVIVAMSGGVDSAVAAGLLLREGYEVIGLTMRLWVDPPAGAKREGCCSLTAVEDARRAASQLGIPHYIVDLRDEFEEAVINPFVAAYAGGQTPNPCIACNHAVKFAALERTADRLGADHIATGHYARVQRSVDTGRWMLLAATSAEKDQSYALYGLSQAQLARCRFPLGWLESKQSTRNLAAEMGLAVASKRDSQDICFVGDGGYAALVRERSRSAGTPGPIIDAQGRVVGTHGGLEGYTIGQRRRLPPSSSGPWYVTAIDACANAVVVGSHEALLSQGCVVTEVNWVSIDRPSSPLAVSVRIRYNASASPATLVATSDTVQCRFAAPQRAVTPGQAAVFYDGAVVLGGGRIERAVAQEVWQT